MRGREREKQKKMGGEKIAHCRDWDLGSEVWRRKTRAARAAGFERIEEVQQRALKGAHVQEQDIHTPNFSLAPIIQSCSVFVCRNAIIDTLLHIKYPPSVCIPPKSRVLDGVATDIEQEDVHSPHAASSLSATFEKSVFVQVWKMTSGLAGLATYVEEEDVDQPNVGLAALKRENL